MEFDLDGYNDDKCKQYDVIISEKNEYEDEQFQPKNKLLMFRCPPIRTEYRLTRNFFHVYYVSSNLEHHSLTLFMRENEKGQLPKLEANIYELQMEPIVKDIRRQRFLPGPPKIITQNMRTQKSFRQVEDEINSLEGEIAMPSTLIKSDLPISYLKAKINEKVLQGRYIDKWLSDHVTMSFSKVKSIKLSK